MTEDSKSHLLMNQYQGITEVGRISMPVHSTVNTDMQDEMAPTNHGTVEDNWRAIPSLHPNEVGMHTVSGADKESTSENGSKIQPAANSIADSTDIRNDSAISPITYPVADGSKITLQDVGRIVVRGAISAELSWTENSKIPIAQLQLFTCDKNPAGWNEANPLTGDPANHNDKKNEDQNGTPKDKKYALKLRYVLREEDADGKVLGVEKSDEAFGETAEEEIPIVEVVTVRTTWRDREKTDLKYYHILSPYLTNALRSVVKYGSHELESDIPKFPEPYRLLYLHMDKLRDFKNQHPEQHTEEHRTECNKHIDFLLGLLDDKEGRRVRIEQARWKREKPCATFRNLWMLLQPGTFAFRQEDNELAPYYIDYVSSTSSQGKSSNCIITAWNLEYDGEYFGRASRVIEIKPFDGEVEITKLKIYPAEYHPDYESMRVKFIKRGKKFFKTVKQMRYRQYTGKTVRGPKRDYERARVVIDYSLTPWDTNSQHKWNHWPELDDSYLYANHLAVCLCDACEDALETNTKAIQPTSVVWEKIDPEIVSELRDDQYFLCPRIVWGYVLKERQWRMLDISGIEEITFDSHMMKSLVLNESHKHVIQAVCHKYSRRTDGNDEDVGYSADFVEGKGVGRIFLLHGPPGVGKTLTAECVAEHTHRPLLSITAGDVGLVADDVQLKLDRFFRWAEDWGAVLLLDEADVYLESRSKTDLERNSVVSVFLRALEYYTGILFITTNRVGTFDEAFTSRIHISLPYQGFDEESRRKVWENNFKKLERERPNITIDGSVRDLVLRDPEVKKLQLNGREIRNCFQTAVTLAEYEQRDTNGDIELDRVHLEKVIGMSQAFEEYMTKTHGGTTASDRARYLEIRADEPDEPSSLGAAARRRKRMGMGSEGK